MSFEVKQTVPDRQKQSNAHWRAILAVLGPSSNCTRENLRMKLRKAFLGANCTFSDQTFFLQKNSARTAQKSHDQKICCFAKRIGQRSFRTGAVQAERGQCWPGRRRSTLCWAASLRTTMRRDSTCRCQCARRCPPFLLVLGGKMCNLFGLLETAKKRVSCP